MSETDAAVTDGHPHRLTTEDCLCSCGIIAGWSRQGSKSFRDWSEFATEPSDQATLREFGTIEQQQATAIGAHLRELGGRMGDSTVPLEDAIQSYLVQVNRLPTLGERLRFNHTVMNTLERPIVMRVLLEHTGKSTQELFERILNNEDRILGWCDRRATELGVTEVDMDKYFSDVIAEA